MTESKLAARFDVANLIENLSDDALAHAVKVAAWECMARARQGNRKPIETFEREAGSVRWFTYRATVENLARDAVNEYSDDTPDDDRAFEVSSGALVTYGEQLDGLYASRNWCEIDNFESFGSGSFADLIGRAAELALREDVAARVADIRAEAAVREGEE